jgi:trk system potassium uptake protein TrkA
VKIVIVGCGRVGAAAAETWDGNGHEVLILDITTRAFERLPSTFGGRAVRGDGTDEDVQRRAGAEGADILLAVTEGDNRNIMSAQLAAEALGVERVIAKLNDPVRAAAYAELGIATLCRTGLMVDALNDHLGFPQSGLAGLLAATGHHPGPHHGQGVGGVAGGETGDPAGSGVVSAASPSMAAPNATSNAAPDAAREA